MGSFHIGGRRVEVHGFPVSMQQLAPNGVPARFDPNGGYMVEQMYVQYFVPQPLYGKAPLLLWHGAETTSSRTPAGRRCDSADLRLRKAFEAVAAAVTSSICPRAASGEIRTF